MASLIFSLRGVPEDEAEEIRQLLSENQIDYYETSAGNWGISMPALWLNDESQQTEANRLLNLYHEQRAKQQRELYQQLKTEGRHKRFSDNIRQNPLQLILYLATLALMIYVPIKFILELGL